MAVAHLVLLGHSMGGLIALDLAVRPKAPLDGPVVSAPAACPGEVSKIQLAIGRVLSRIAPNVGVLRLPLNRISRDPRSWMRTTTTRSCFARRYERASARRSRRDGPCRRGCPSMRMPLLVMQGTADGLVDPGCGPHVYDRGGSTDKTLKMYDGLWHEIFNEPERDQVLPTSPVG